MDWYWIVLYVVGGIVGLGAYMGMGYALAMEWERYCGPFVEHGAEDAPRGVKLFLCAFFAIIVMPALISFYLTRKAAEYVPQFIDGLLAVMVMIFTLGWIKYTNRDQLPPT